MASTAATGINLSVRGRTDRRQLRLRGITADTSFSIPAGFAIADIFVSNSTANAITGGIDLGTTDGGAEVVNANAVGASAFKKIPDASILLHYWSKTVATTLYLTATTAWNNANIDCTICLEKISF